MDEAFEEVMELLQEQADIRQQILELEERLEHITEDLKERGAEEV